MKGRKRQEKRCRGIQKSSELEERGKAKRRKRRKILEKRRENKKKRGKRADKEGRNIIRIPHLS